LGCKLGQGYLFSQPVSAEQAEKIITEGVPLDFSKIEMPFAFADLDSSPSINLGTFQ
jgi:hypothetical protein